MKSLFRAKLPNCLTFFSTLGFLLTTLGGCAKSQNPTLLATVDYADVIQRVTVPGTVSSNRKTMISAPYSGYVHKIYVQLGQKVSPGDPIVGITQSLRNSNEEIYPLRAPFAGTVVQVLRTEGEYVDSVNNTIGNSIIRIDDLSKLFIEAIAPEAEISKLKKGQEVEIKVSALLSKSYRGKIKTISLASKEQRDWSDKTRVEFTLQIEVLDPDSNLLPGMSVIVDIITNRVDHVLTLRHEYIQKNDGKYSVITSDGTKKEILVGVQNEEIFEVKSGLKLGEKIQQNDFLKLLESNGN